MMERERRLEKERKRLANCETPIVEDNRTSAELRTEHEIKLVENLAILDRDITQKENEVGAGLYTASGGSCAKDSRVLF